MVDENDPVFQFFGGYFHEDWMLDAASTREVVGEYVKAHTPEERSALSRAVVEYSQKFASDSELEDGLFHELGCYYTPSGIGLSAKAWLQTVASQILHGT